MKKKPGVIKRKGQGNKKTNQQKHKTKRKTEDDDENDYFEVVNENKASTVPQMVTKEGDGELSTREMVKTQNKKQKKSGGFQSMGLSHNIFKGVTRKGYKVPTPIQRKTIPVIMDGKDVVAMARTGSGKTAAFLIPMFEKLQAHSNNGARAVILSPTRELAVQTLKFAKELGKFMDLKTSLILGGDSMENQFAAFHQNPDILIATPGRFLHLLVEMDIKRLDQIEYVVFDEADRLFEMGFAEQLHEIIRRIPESRQTLLFSATLPKVLVDFTSAGLTDPTLIRLDVDTKISDKLKMSFFMTRPEEKLGCLLHLLQTKINTTEQTVIFAATKHHVEYLNQLLSKAGISCTYIYSSLDQSARKINLAKFRKKIAMVLIVTDIAARGIDIPMLDNVINYDFPSKPKLFVHRVGRVARAGRSGIAYSFVMKDELAFVVDLHLFLGRPLKIANASTSQDADGTLGSISQTSIAEETEYVKKLSSTDFTLISLEKVMSNGYKQYVRSREAASEESIRRSKEMNQTIIQLHPMFRSESEETNQDLTNLLYNLQKFKPKITIFEAMNTKKSKETESVMKEKRKYHSDVIERTKQIVKEKEKEIEDMSTKGERTSVSNEQYIAETFQTKSHKDTENYIPRQASDYHGEKGFTVKSFDKDVQSVSVDLVADETERMKKQTSTKKWDRKRKKFVSIGGGNSAKKMKTESGSYIKASYKSNRYDEWMKQNNMIGLKGRENSEEIGNQFSIMSKRGKFSKKKGGLHSTGGKKNGKGVLKTKDEMIKKRLIDERSKNRDRSKQKGRSVSGSRGGKGGRKKR